MQKISDFFYEKPFINTIDMNDIYFFFDYDERFAAINMEFQHLHPFYELMLYLGEQKAKHYINGVPYEIKCGDIILLKPGLLHMSEYPAGNPSDRLIIQFSLPNTNKELKHFHQILLSVFDAGCPIYRFADPVRKQIVGDFNIMFTYLHREECTDTSLGKHMLYHYFIEFLYHIYSNQDQNIYSPQKESDGLTQKIYEINNYILSHYSENLTLDSLSKQFFISPFYLSHQFKEINQFTLTEYIQNTRIKNAQYLLMSSGLSITDIAAQCGFNSFSQFNRLFRRYCGCSPSNYQKQQRVAKI